MYAAASIRITTKINTVNGCYRSGPVRDYAVIALTTGRPAALIHNPIGQVAQLVEQGTENPRVGSSILSLATIIISNKNNK